MNTHDVSTTPGCIKLLQQHKQRLRDVEPRKGQRPSTERPRDETILQFNTRREMNQRRSRLNFNIRSSIIPAAYHPCTRSLHDLQKITLQDLRLETHHRGTYLILRSVTPPDEMMAIMAIVEDENGDVIMLQLYNQDRDRAPEETFPEGTVLIVKEPYLKLMSDGDYGIRVDHVSDVLFLAAHDGRVPRCWRTERADGGKYWKTKGDELFDSAKYQLAVGTYTMALDCLPVGEERNTLRLSRASALIKSNQFEGALFDLKSVPQTGPFSENVIFYKAQAFYNLRRYQECHDILNSSCTEFPDRIEAKDYHLRVLERLEEQRSGRYQFKQMYEAAKIFPPNLDHATYIGPVAVKPSGSRGRGLFTTKAVKAGELLICEKAFAHSFVDPESPEHGKNVTLMINAETDTMTVGTQSDLIGLITQKLYHNPALVRTITDLHHGEYDSVSVSDIDGKPVVDTFLVERVIALNAFGCPLSSRDHYLEGTTQRSDTGDQFHSTGVWPSSSYINHSCNSNAQRNFIGDIMIIRATRDLEPDTEITFWYSTPEVDNFDVYRGKFKHWGFQCDCVICGDYQNTDPFILQKRKDLRAEARAYIIQSGQNLDSTRIEDMIASLADTYTRPATEVPRLGTWDIQRVLARIYLAQEQPGKAIDAVFGVLESLGYVIEGGNVPGTPLTITRWGLMVDQLIETWLVLAEAFRVVAPEFERQAEMYAKITYRICVGEDETFEDTYVTSS